MAKIGLLTLLISVLALAVEGAQVQIDTQKENQARFSAPSTLAKVVGTTDAIDGHVQWQGEEWSNQSKFSFKVDLATIDTGIGLRNKHMRNKYLETDTYPYATYIGSITKVTKQDSLWHVETQGTLSIHGVDRQVEISGQVSDSADGFYVEAELELNLADFNIDQPQFLLVKMNEQVKVNVRFYTTKVQESPVQ